MLSGISVWQLLILLAIVVLIFGTKKLKNIGGDLGGAIKSFKSAMNDESKPETADGSPAGSLPDTEKGETSKHSS